MARKRPFRFRVFLPMLAGVIGLLLLVISWAIQYPRIQSFLVEESELILENVLDAEVVIGRVTMALPANAELHDIRLMTQEGQLVGEVKAISLDLLSFSLWEYLLNNRPVHTLSISNLEVFKLNFPLHRTADGELSLNALLGPPKPNKKPGVRVLELNIDRVNLINCRFSYIDSTRIAGDTLPRETFQATRMVLDSIDLDASNISVGPGATFRGNIRHLSVVDTVSGMRVQDLTLSVTADTVHHRDRRGWKEVVSFVNLRGIELEQGLTTLHADITYPRTELMDLLKGDLLYRYFEAEWYNSQLHTSSIQRFVPRQLPIEGLLALRGTTRGTINDLFSPGMTVSLNDRSAVDTRFRLTDLLHYQDTRLDIRVENADMKLYDLRKFLPTSGIPARLDSLVLTEFNGSFTGHYEDFKVIAAANTPQGKLSTDLHLVFPPRAKELSYDGYVETIGVNPNLLGLQETIDSRYLNAKATINGRGTTIGNLRTTLKAKVWDSDLWGYRVDSITTDLSILEKKIAGTGFARHGDGLADVTVDMNLGLSPAYYKIFGGVRKIDLHKYDLWEEPLIVSTRFSSEFTGDSLEQVAGHFDLRESSIINQAGRLFNFYQTTLDVTRNSQGDKVFELTSPVADGNLRGNFTLQKIGKLMSMLAEESQLYFSNEDSLINAYYAEKNVDTLTTIGDLQLTTNPDLNELMRFLGIPVRVSNNSTASAHFEFGPIESLSVETTSDSVKYTGVVFENLNGTAEIIKNASDNKLALLSLLNIDRVNTGEGRYLDLVSWEIDGIDNHYNGTFTIRQEEGNNAIKILSVTDFMRDGRIVSALNTDKSELVVNGDTLTFMPNNEVIYNQGQLDIRNIVLQSEATYFRLDGLISENPQDVLSLSVGQLPLSIIGDFTEVPYLPSGMFNLEVNFQQLFTDPCLTVRSRVDEFALDDYPYGNIFAEGHWQSSNGHLNLDATLFSESDTTLHLQGYYDLPDTIAPLHFSLGTEKGFPFDYAYPFVKTQLYELKGTVDLDKFTITGSPSEPVILGTGHFADAGFGVDYFKTSYTFGGTITFDNDRIEFPRIRLYDQNNSYAQLYGFIYHKGLSDFRFDLQVEQARNFLLMNTRKGDNELFYGRIVLKDGLGSVTGDLDKLRLEMFATSGRGSFLKIPLEDEAAEGRPDFIRFAGEDKTTSTYETGLKDFEIDLNVSMTPDLEVDLIFDEKVGDIIRGKGVGNLSLYINESGEFTMFGDYQITEGNYLFTAQNILNKKFLVKPGGTIIWTGDPYDAQLNLDAYYPLYADISQLLQEDRTIRTPVNVNMAMDGSLLSPEIDLSIELPSLNEGDATQISSYLKSIQYDEQELNKQVFSLMVFNRFAPVGGFLGTDAASSGVTTSISELISNQLNYWLGQAIGENVNVGVGTNNFQDVNLLLSASLFDDRVVIERDGTLIDDNSNLAIGNVSIQIKLLPARGSEQEGVVRQSELILEVFTRESLDANLNSNTYQAGAGVFYKKDFDKVGELFQKRRKKR